MIFQGIWTKIAKRPYIFAIFSGGPDPLSPSLDPHMICSYDVPHTHTCTLCFYLYRWNTFDKKCKNSGTSNRVSAFLLNICYCVFYRIDILSASNALNRLHDCGTPWGFYITGYLNSIQHKLFWVQNIYWVLIFLFVFYSIFPDFVFLQDFSAFLFLWFPSLLS